MGVQTTLRRAAERVPPRRRRRKRGIWQNAVWPLLKVAVVVALSVMIVNVAIGKISRPFKLLNREYRETQHLAGQVDALRKENAALARQIRYLRTSQGAAQAARKLGYVKPGEITLVIPPEHNKSH